VKITVLAVVYIHSLVGLQHGVCHYGFEFNDFLHRPVSVRSIVISQSVCASVCLSVRSHNSKTVRPNLTKFLHVALGRGSVLPWRRCYMLCTSGLRMTSCFHSMGPIGGRTGTALLADCCWRSAGRCA